MRARFRAFVVGVRGEGVWEEGGRKGEMSIWGRGGIFFFFGGEVVEVGWVGLKWEVEWGAQSRFLRGFDGFAWRSACFCPNRYASPYPAEHRKIANKMLAG